MGIRALASGLGVRAPLSFQGVQGIHTYIYI